LIDWYFGAPRRAYALICIACIGMLAFGMYLQHVVGLEPCPMCVVQRYALVLVGVFAAIAAVSHRKGVQVPFALLALLAAIGGAYTAARQSWLQWHPPEFVSCGRDIYGMIETFPLQRALPMIFKGSGDCSKVDWTLLGLSIANWSFIAFVVFGLLLIVLVARSFRRAPAYSGSVSKAA
jgi:protein dithiol:quinone oxidoreductase